MKSLKAVLLDQYKNMTEIDILLLVPGASVWMIGAVPTARMPLPRPPPQLPVELIPGASVWMIGIVPTARMPLPRPPQLPVELELSA